METIILTLYNTKKSDCNLELLTTLKRNFSKKNNLPDLPSNIQLLQTYERLVQTKKIIPSPDIEQLLKKRAIRSQSGIVSVQVLTKPFACPGKCIFCPNDSQMPKSYIKSEPGAMRALLNHFDPIKQVYNRLLSLTLTGHKTDKIEMIVLGGTFDVYTKDYKTKFMKSLYDACNTFDEYRKNIKISTTQKYSHAIVDTTKKITYTQTLAQALKKNEHAKHRIIGLTIETRPEYVTDQNCQFWRELGVTRIEMGVQSLDEQILAMNKRGHTVQQAREACHILKQYGFKISLHIMPGLYGSTYKKDLQTFVSLYTDPYFKPDEIKFYPTSVIPHTELCTLYTQGKYIPLTTPEIKKLIAQTFLEVIPPYTRIKRLIRDIPATEIVAGSKITNLAQLMHSELFDQMKNPKNTMMRKQLYQRLYGNYKNYISLAQYLKEEKKSLSLKKEEIQTAIIGQTPDVRTLRNFVSLDTRSREMRNRTKKVNTVTEINQIVRKYQSSAGIEYFIACEDTLGYLYGFTRLLLPTQGKDYKGLVKKSAIIRELHVYGQVEGLSPTKKSSNSVSQVQHTGFGKQLMEMAEKITQLHDFTKLSVISGVGVRAYYRKLGYKLEGTYMVKKI